MANQMKLFHVTTILFLLVTICEARPLTNIYTAFSATKVSEAFGSMSDDDLGLPAASPGKGSGTVDDHHDQQHVLPREVASTTSFNTRETQPAKKTTGKFGNLFLNSKPKGTVPPSGPSKRHN